MNVKLIELRDSMTFIPIMGIEVSGGDGYLMGRAGWAREQRGLYMFDLSPEGTFHFAMGLIGSGVLHTTHGIESYDRTYRKGFTELNAHWDQYKSGDVLDVEYVLGESDTPKESEQYA